MRDETLLLEDVLEAIDKIQKYVSQGEDAFYKDELIQTWVIHHIQIIGEAARKFSEETTQKYPNIPWKQIVGMRHILVHDYFGVDLHQVWATVANDLPTLKKEIEGVLKGRRDRG